MRSDWINVFGDQPSILTGCLFGQAARVHGGNCWIMRGKLRMGCCIDGSFGYKRAPAVLSQQYASLNGRGGGALLHYDMGNVAIEIAAVNTALSRGDKCLGCAAYVTS